MIRTACSLGKSTEGYRRDTQRNLTTECLDLMKNNHSVRCCTNDYVFEYACHVIMVLLCVLLYCCYYSRDYCCSVTVCRVAKIVALIHCI